MNAGDLRQRVTVQTRTETEDGHDGFTTAWTAALSRTPAVVVALSGRELERARVVDPRASHEVRLRYWSAYSTALAGGRARLIWHDGDIGDRTLEPVEPPREVEPRKTLAMVCREAQ